MAETMQAVVTHGPRDYRLEERPRPTAGPGEALVQVEAVGICASDLKCYHGATKFWGDEHRPAYVETPVIPGHEFVGRVVELDEAAAARWGVAVGDRVTSEQIVPCWQCRYCRRGQYWMCAPHDIYGFKRRTPGAMAEYMVFPADALVHKVSDQLPAAHAAFIEPLSCALHAVERGNIGFEDVVVVAGCGPIGLGMVAGAAAKSPAQVIALDLADHKLALAEAVRGDAHPQHRHRRRGRRGPRPDRRLRRRRLPRGQRPPVRGRPGAAAVAQAGHVRGVQRLRLRRDRRLVDHLRRQGAGRPGAHLGPHCWPAAGRMLESGRLPLGDIVTHQLPLSEFQQGLDLVADGSASIKVSLLPQIP